MLSSVEIAASWVALGLTGRAMGEFWCSFYCAIHPTPRGRPLRGAGCNSRPLLFPDLPFTPRSRYQPARWRWGSVGGPRAGFAVIFSPNSTPHPAGARCAAPDALRSKWRHLTSRSPGACGGFPVKQGAPKNEVGAPFGIIASVYIGIFGQVSKYRHSPRILALLVERLTSMVLRSWVRFSGPTTFLGGALETPPPPFFRRVPAGW